MTSLSLNAAGREFGEMPGTFSPTRTGAKRLRMGVDGARLLLAAMQRSDRSMRVGRDGWLPTLRHREPQVPTVLGACLRDISASASTSATPQPHSFAVHPTTWSFCSGPMSRLTTSTPWNSVRPEDSQTWGWHSIRPTRSTAEW